MTSIQAAVGLRFFQGNRWQGTDLGEQAHHDHRQVHDCGWSHQDLAAADLWMVGPAAIAARHSRARPLTTLSSRLAQVGSVAPLSLSPRDPRLALLERAGAGQLREWNGPRLPHWRDGLPAYEGHMIRSSWHANPGVLPCVRCSQPEPLPASPRRTRSWHTSTPSSSPFC